MPTYDNSATLNLDSSGANTALFTCTGSNLVLIFGGIYDTNNITAISYAGAALTSIATTYGHFYYLVNPATGSNTLSVTRSGFSVDGIQTIISISDAKQAAPTVNSSFTNPTGNKTGYSNSIVTTTDSSLIVDFFSLGSDPTNGNPNPAATGTGHTRRAYQYAGGGDQVGEGVGTTTTTTAGSYPSGYSWSTVNNVSSQGNIFEILPVPVSTSGFNIAFV